MKPLSWFSFLHRRSRSVSQTVPHNLNTIPPESHQSPLLSPCMLHTHTHTTPPCYPLTNLTQINTTFEEKVCGNTHTSYSNVSQRSVRDRTDVSAFLSILEGFSPLNQSHHLMWRSVVCYALWSQRGSVWVHVGKRSMQPSEAILLTPVCRLSFLTSCSVSPWNNMLL